MDLWWEVLNSVNDVLWHNVVLYVVLGVGVLFTLWSGFSQYRALTHGSAVTLGKYSDKTDPGAINHFQALSAALSATVGLGNIGGVALAISLGGPGAVFWMWMVGLVGMALKTTEVTLAMLYRNTDDPDNPHGGAMWVASKGFARWGLGRLGALIGAVFCVTLLISAVTGGNMFQAWNVAEITASYTTLPRLATGLVLAVVVGLVIIGGIKRIGSVAGALVPLMCLIYLLAAVYVLLLHYAEIPGMLWLIVRSAFSPADAQNAFLGGTAGYAFLWGMKRALFSNEAGQGSSPIAHSAAKTDEPAREGVVAGLEPFIDTIVVCTLTTLVVLLSGAWNRGPEATFDEAPAVINADRVHLAAGESVVGRVISQGPAGIEVIKANAGLGESPVARFEPDEVKQIEKLPNQWLLDTRGVPEKTDEALRVTGAWKDRDTVFVLVRGELDPNTGRDLHRLTGTIRRSFDSSELRIVWNAYQPRGRTAYGEGAPEVVLEASGEVGLYNDFVGAALTGHAFDRVTPGLGRWVVTVACWLFAVSTMISWSYYGEQGVVYLLGQRLVMPYRIVYCLLILVATSGFIRTDAQLDGLTALGTGVMLWANIPIMLVFGYQAMSAYHDYVRRLRAGELAPQRRPPLVDVVEGKDVE